MKPYLLKGEPLGLCRGEPYPGPGVVAGVQPQQSRGVLPQHGGLVPCPAQPVPAHVQGPQPAQAPPALQGGDVVVAGIQELQVGLGDAHRAPSHQFTVCSGCSAGR